MKIILMGPPGVGKGTQGDRLSKKLGINKISTGDLFRSHRNQSTELGILASHYMDKGEYVPDHVTIGMVIESIGLAENCNGFILDGFPRTIAQATALDAEIGDSGGIDLVICMVVERDELVKRLSGRQICKSCQAPFHMDSAPSKKPGECDFCEGMLYQREDDRHDVVNKRLSVYLKETEPLLDYYKDSGKLTEIIANGTPDEVERLLILTLTDGK